MRDATFVFSALAGRTVFTTVELPIPGTIEKLPTNSSGQVLGSEEASQIEDFQAQLLSGYVPVRFQNQKGKPLVWVPSEQISLRIVETVLV